MSIKLISLMVALVTVCANGASLNNGKAPCSITENDHCKINPCKNGAACTDLGDDYKCTCPRGYAGKNCNECKESCHGMMPGSLNKNPYDKCESMICDTMGRAGDRYTTLNCTDPYKLERPSCQKFCLHWQKCERHTEKYVLNMQCCDGKVPPLTTTTVAP